MGNVTASFFGSYLRTLGALPLPTMSAVILELQAAGEPELALELMAIRERWRKAVSRSASRYAPARPGARATEHSADRTACKLLVLKLRGEASSHG